ncbi:MAG: PQQ-dependent sugar dehydrogenase [Rhodothermales bacterium]
MLPRFTRSAWRIAAMLCLVGAVAGGAYRLIPYGLDAPAPVGRFLNGAFPSTTPQPGAKAVSWRATPAFPDVAFTDAMAIAPVPGTTYLCVAERSGLIWFIENDPATRLRLLVADLRDRVELPRDGGFMGIAFHPHFAAAGTTGAGEVFVSYNAVGGTMRLSRFTMASATVLDLHSEEVMIDLSRHGGDTHFGGSLAFGPDGMLYVPFGEAEKRIEDAQTISDNLLGGILRLDVDRDPARSHPPRRMLPQAYPGERSGIGYWIPNDNPFVDPAGGSMEEYFSIGHRNPWRLSIDGVSGRIWVSEVGHLQRDEFNVIEKGGNYGWFMREGSTEARLAADEQPAPPAQVLGTLREPALDARFGVVSGGVTYRGAALPELYGRYIGYAGGLVALRYDEATGKATAETLLTPAQLQLPYAFGADHAGELLFVEGGENKPILRLDRVGASGDEPPALLSETGAFKDLATLEPADGLIPYALIAPFWSDAAIKSRWMAVPNDGTHDAADEQITIQDDGIWRFPVGTVLVKHFEMDMDETSEADAPRRLETRFLVHGEDGIYYGLTYRWNEAGTDAVLLADSLVENLAIRGPEGIRLQPWLYPARTQCETCHGSAAGFTLGPRSHQLNADLRYPQTGRVANQLATLNHLGLFKTPLDEAGLATALTAAAPGDTSASLEQRARSYLDANCSSCHRPGGVGRALFDARLATPLADANLIDGYVLSPIGIPDGVAIAPGDTARSVLYRRLNSLDPLIAMPPLAKSRIDTAGVALLAAWIQSLGEDNEHPVAVQTETPLHFGIRGVFPNPVAGAATAVIELHRAGPATVDVFDGLGRPVRRLMNESRAPGRHELHLDAGGLSAGVYYLVLEADGRRETRPITVVR